MRASHRGLLTLAAVLGFGVPTGGWCQFQGGATVVGAPTPDQDALGAKDANDLRRKRPADDTASPTAPKLTDSDRLKLGVQAAQELLKAQRYADALAKMRELDALPGKAAADSYLLERTRLAAASQLGDNPLVIQSLQAVLATGQAPADEELKFSDLLARHYFNLKDYAQAIQWIDRYHKAGGTDAEMRRSLLYAYYLRNEHARVVQEIAADIQADEKAQRTPAEYQLKLLASSAQQLNDKATYDMALAKHASYYPKKP